MIASLVIFRIGHTVFYFICTPGRNCSGLCLLASFSLKINSFIPHDQVQIYHEVEGRRVRDRYTSTDCCGACTPKLFKSRNCHGPAETASWTANLLSEGVIDS